MTTPDSATEDSAPAVKGLVSVIMPVYNREQYVEAAIASILQQTYSQVEVVAINDGSTDGSLAILRRLQKEHPERIQIIDQKNQGQVRSRNTGIGRARGEYIAFLDSDDLWLPQKLEKQLPLFVGNVGLVYCAIDNIDRSGEWLSTDLCNPDYRGDIYAKILIKNCMTGGSVVLARHVFDTAGYFDPSVSPVENWDLWIRVCKHFQVDFINEPMVQYRKHDTNISNNNESVLAAMEQIIERQSAREGQQSEFDAACRAARTNLEYNRGVYHFSRGNYALARQALQATLDLTPGYRDARIRMLRSYLGRTGNGVLAALKSVVGGKQSGRG